MSHLYIDRLIILGLTLLVLLKKVTRTGLFAWLVLSKDGS